MAAILNSAFLHSTILHRKNFTHSFWLNLMRVAIFNSAILDSTILHKILTQTNSILNSAILDSFILHKTLTQTNSIWLKLIHSHLTWWWQPSSIWSSWIQPSCFFLSYSLSLAKNGSHHLHTKKLTHISLPTICTKKLHSFILTQFDEGSHSEFCHVRFNHFYTKNLHLFILTQLDDGSHLQFGHLGFSHLSFSSQTHSHFPTLIPTICTKKLHSFILTQLMMAAILKSAILDSAILHKTLTQTYSFSLNLIMAAIFNSAILDSPIFLKTLTQTNSIWLKLIHSLSTWWWQPSSIWPSWIQPS